MSITNTTMKKLTFLFLPVLVALLFAGFASVALAQTTDANFQNALTQLRQLRQNFKDAKAQEISGASEEGKAKGQVQRQAAQQKREEARQRMEEKRKETLLKLVDIQIKWLNRVKERVSKMPNISADLKTQLAAEVDTAIQGLNGFKTRIQSASGRDAIRALAKEVRDFFKLKHEIVRKIVDAIHVSRATNSVAKAEERAAAVKAKVQELKNQGKNTAEVETELADAEKKIDDAQEAVGRKAFKETNEDLKGAYQKFRGIATKAKGL